MLDLLEKDLKSTIKKFSRNYRKMLSKELEEAMTMFPHQIHKSIKR